MDMIECNVDLMDVSGQNDIDTDYHNSIHKFRLGEDGSRTVPTDFEALPSNYCGPCYGAHQKARQV